MLMMVMVNGHMVTWSLGHMISGPLVPWSLGHLVTGQVFLERGGEATEGLADEAAGLQVGR